MSERICGIDQANRQVYGSPRIHAALHANGHACGKKRGARLMRACGLSAQLRRHRTKTTDSQHEHPVAENVLGRDLPASAPNTKWVAAITGGWTMQGWLSLAGVLDISSRRVGGWAMDAHREALLVENARHDGPGAAAS